MQGEDELEWWDDGGPPPQPPCDLPDDPEPEDVDALAEVVRVDRAHNRFEGDRARWILQLLRETTPVGPISAREQVAGEIGPALKLGSGAATKLVDISVALRDRLPATLRAVCDGHLSWYMATILAEGVAALTDEQARAVEDTVLAKALTRTPAQHRDAVRRAVAQVDPDGADRRRKQQQKAVRLVRTHYGDGMGNLFAEMRSEQLDTVWDGCDFWARCRKAAGDPRSLDELRVAALTQWAQSFMHHGDPAYCDRWCEPGSHGGRVDNTDTDTDDSGDGDADDGNGGGDNGPDEDAPTGGAGSDLEPVDDQRPDGEQPASTPPTRHGRPAALHALWDLTSLLGLTRHCGELADSGAMMPPAAMSDLVAGGVQIRRMLIDPDTGELLDLTPRTWQLPRTKATELDAPVVLGVIVTTDMWQAIADGTADPALLAAIEQAPQAVRDLLAHAWTADDLDNHPERYRPSARLAEFITTRDRHPTNPTAGPTSASAADIEHVTPHAKGGTTTRNGLTTNVRRWHNHKTHGGWTVQLHGRGWKWTSPRGRSYYTQPYDYRLGP